MAGAVARKRLATAGIELLAHTVEIGGVKAASAQPQDIRDNAEADGLRCATQERRLAADESLDEAVA